VPEERIPAEGRIVEVLDRQAYRVELANGHVCIARAPRRAKDTFDLGANVRLSFHPADLSRARIVDRAS
jgi:translation initiation factor IF-1